eukprot:354165-Chlamydomonas_euryale.AAC.1
MRCELSSPPSRWAQPCKARQLPPLPSGFACLNFRPMQTPNSTLHSHTIHTHTIHTHPQVYAGRPVFPYGEFARPVWLSLLRDVGLIGADGVDSDVFLAAAMAIDARAAALAGSVSEAERNDALACGGALVAHLRERASVLLARPQVWKCGG